MIKKIRPVLTLLAVLTVVAFVAVTVGEQDWSALAALAEPRALALVGAGLVANAAGLLLGMLSWRALIVGAGAPVGMWAVARIYFVGFMTKFVPGRVWTLLANIQMGKASGIPPARTATVYLVNIAVGTLTGLTTGLVAAPAVLGEHGAWMGLAAIPVVACVIRPDLTHRVATAAARVLRRPGPLTRTSDRAVRLSIVLQTLSWLVSGHHLWFLAVAAGAPPLRSYVICVGSFGLAVVAGHLMVLVPDGLGVREAILLAALTTVLPLPVAGTIVLTSRLVCTVSEVGLAAAVLGVAQLRVRAGKGRAQSPGAVSASPPSLSEVSPASGKPRESRESSEDSPVDSLEDSSGEGRPRTSARTPARAPEREKGVGATP